jgi:hypothetical protein
MAEHPSIAHNMATPVCSGSSPQPFFCGHSDLVFHAGEYKQSDVFPLLRDLCTAHRSLSSSVQQLASFRSAGRNIHIAPPGIWSRPPGIWQQTYAKPCAFFVDPQAHADNTARISCLAQAQTCSDELPTPKCSSFDLLNVTYCTDVSDSVKPGAADPTAIISMNSQVLDYCQTANCTISDLVEIRYSTDTSASQDITFANQTGSALPPEMESPPFRDVQCKSSVTPGTDHDTIQRLQSRIDHLQECLAGVVVTFEKVHESTHTMLCDFLNRFDASFEGTLRSKIMEVLRDDALAPSLCISLPQDSVTLASEEGSTNNASAVQAMTDQPESLLHDASPYTVIDYQPDVTPSSSMCDLCFSTAPHSNNCSDILHPIFCPACVAAHGRLEKLYMKSIEREDSYYSICLNCKNQRWPICFKMCIPGPICDRCFYDLESTRYFYARADRSDSNVASSIYIDDSLPLCISCQQLHGHSEFDGLCNLCVESSSVECSDTEVHEIDKQADQTALCSSCRITSGFSALDGLCDYCTGLNDSYHFKFSQQQYDSSSSTDD